MEEKHLSAVHDDVELFFCDPRGVLCPLDGAGEQLFCDAGVAGNYVKFEECLLWLRLDGREPINGRAGVLPLVGEHGGPDGGVDPVQDEFADGPNGVLGGVNQPALNSAGVLLWSFIVIKASSSVGLSILSSRSYVRAMFAASLAISSTLLLEAFL